MNIKKKLKSKFKIIKTIFSRDLSQKMFLIIVAVAVPLLIVTTGALALQINHKDAAVKSGQDTRTLKKESKKAAASSEKDANKPAESKPNTTQNKPTNQPHKQGGAPSAQKTGGVSFSMSTDKISLPAGETSSYITLQSSSGLYWTIDGGSVGIYTIFDSNAEPNVNSPPRSSLRFRIKTEANAVPKTYKFVVKAGTDRSFRNNVTTKTLSVTVGGHKDFKVAFSTDETAVDDANGQLNIPFTVTRENGHNDQLSATATITHAAGFHSINVSGFMSGFNTGYVFVNIPAGTPPGDYTVVLYLQDSLLSTHSDAFILEVY